SATTRRWAPPCRPCKTAPAGTGRMRCTWPSWPATRWCSASRRPDCSGGNERIPIMAQAAVRSSELIDRGGPRLHPRLRFPLLALATGVSAVSTAAGYKTWARFEFGVGVVVATAVWMLIFTVVMRDWENRPGTVATYYTGRTALAAVLVGVNPWFALYAFIGY